MEQKSFSLTNYSMNPYFFLTIFSLYSLSVVEAYKNYTVGDSLGWYDNTEKHNINYQKWVSGKVFSLGDFLIFNTNSNHSIVQTYNFTTYKRCDYNNAEEDDTIEWSAANPSSTSPVPVSVPIPLVKEGMIYFFSGDYDGDQCKHGQHFKINVTYGQGLPPSLKNIDQSSPSPTTSTSGDDDDSTPNPDTPVSSNFNNPKYGSGEDEHGVKENSGSVSLRWLEGGFGMNCVWILVMIIVTW